MTGKSRKHNKTNWQKGEEKGNVSIQSFREHAKDQKHPLKDKQPAKVWLPKTDMKL